MRSFLFLCQQSDFPIPRGQSSEFQGPSLLPLIYEGRLVSLLGEVSVSSPGEIVPIMQRTLCLQPELILWATK